MADDLEDLAKAGVKVLGSDDTLFEHRCRPGSWLFGGGLIAGIVAQLHIGIGWIVPIMLALGWALNEYEQRQIRARVARQQKP